MQGDHHTVGDCRHTVDCFVPVLGLGATPYLNLNPLEFGPTVVNVSRGREVCRVGDRPCRW